LELNQSGQRTHQASPGFPSQEYRTIRFPKLDDPVSAEAGQKTANGTGSGSAGQENQTVRFPKSDGSISTYSGEKPIKQIYRLKSEIVDERASKMDLDAEKPAEKVIKIGSIDVPIKEDGKRPIVNDNPAKTEDAKKTTHFPPGANDHKASSSKDVSK